MLTHSRTQVFPCWVLLTQKRSRQGNRLLLSHRRVSKCSVEKTVAPDLVWCTGASCCCQPPASARCGRMSENPVNFWWIRDSLRTTRDQVCTPAIINRPSHHSVLLWVSSKKLAAVQKDTFSKVSFFGANVRVLVNMVYKDTRTPNSPQHTS